MHSEENLNAKLIVFSTCHVLRVYAKCWHFFPVRFYTLSSLVDFTFCKNLLVIIRCISIIIPFLHTLSLHTEISPWSHLIMYY